NIHAADIRSDLYSLGCTFYFALAGHVPFPEGNDLEKLVKHLLYQAPPLNTVRRDVPAVVAAIIQRLMAKQRARRIQTPAALAPELAVVQKRGLSPVFCPQRTEDHSFTAHEPGISGGPSSLSAPENVPSTGHSQATPSTVDDLLSSTVATPPTPIALLPDW